MNENEAAVRKAYQVAEDKDIIGWVNCFTKDGTFTDESIGVTYSGPDELGRTVETYATAFPDMHRELYRFYVTGDTVVVELALQGTTKARWRCRREPCRRQESGWMHRAVTYFA